MNKSKLIQNIVKAKVIIRRQRENLSYLQTAMIAYLYFEKVGWSWWYLILIPIILIITWVDTLYLFGPEQDYQYNKSRFMRDLKKEKS